MFKKVTVGIVLFSFIVTSTQTLAFAVGSAGFENATFSSYSLAQGGATVAQADEPAAISYNPAGLVQLRGVQAQSNMAFISGFTFYESDTQGSTKSTGTVIPIPTGYLSVNPGRIFNDKVAFGVGSDSPFGLSKKYDSMSPIARYTGYETWLKMYTVKPTVSVKLHEKFLVGAGPIYYRAFDFGGIQKYPNSLIASGLADGQVRLDRFQGNTWGWQFGLLAKIHPKHQLGFYFRSPVTLKTAGLIKVENSAVSGNFETGGNTKIDLPLNFTWAYAFKPTKKTTLETDFGFTRWEAHKRLYINAAPVSAADDAVLSAIGKADKDWQNSFTIHLGGKHRIKENLELLAGSYFVTAAVPEEHFLPSVPDSNRLSFSLGLKYSPIANVDVGAAYMILFNLRRHIDNSISEVLGTSVDGTYSGVLQDFVLSFTYRFESIFGSDKELETQENGNPEIKM